MKTRSRRMKTRMRMRRNKMMNDYVDMIILVITSPSDVRDRSDRKM